MNKASQHQMHGGEDAAGQNRHDEKAEGRRQRQADADGGGEFDVAAAEQASDMEGEHQQEEQGGAAD